MTERTAKQVIVMRKDLGTRNSTMIAQGAHAALDGGPARAHALRR